MVLPHLQLRVPTVTAISGQDAQQRRGPADYGELCEAARAVTQTLTEDDLRGSLIYINAE